MGACLWDDREPAAERIEAQFRQIQTVDREPAGFELAPVVEVKDSSSDSSSTSSDSDTPEPLLEEPPQG